MSGDYSSSPNSGPAGILGEYLCSLCGNNFTTVTWHAARMRNKMEGEVACATCHEKMSKAVKEVVSETALISHPTLEGGENIITLGTDTDQMLDKVITKFQSQS